VLLSSLSMILNDSKRIEIIRIQFNKFFTFDANSYDIGPLEKCADLLYKYVIY
jgi:hypothetical protein